MLLWSIYSKYKCYSAQYHYVSALYKEEEEEDNIMQR